MKNIMILFALLALIIGSAYAQQTSDSLREGRYCKVVLYNGYQAEGTIVQRGNDTIEFKTDIVELSIPVSDIKFVMNPEIEVSDLEEVDTIDYKKIPVVEPKIDTTNECDIYMTDRSVMKDVLLIVDSDSTIKVVKENRSKIVNIAGIRKIVFKASAPFGNGYLAGSVVGFFIGFIPLAFSKGGGHPDFSGIGPGVILGLICSIPTGLIGGVIGVLTAYDDTYLFENGIYPAKIKRIRHAMSKHY